MSGRTELPRRRPSWGGNYSKLPHGIFDWAAVQEAGDAVLLLLKMSDYASRNETDGRLTGRQVATLAKPRRLRSDLAVLSQWRLIEPDGETGGWVIVGWLDGHRTAEQIADIRRKRSSAGERSAQVRAERAAGDNPTGQQVVEQVVEQVVGQVFEPETGTVTGTGTNPSSSSVTSRAASPAHDDDDDDLAALIWRTAGVASAPTAEHRAKLAEMEELGAQRNDLLAKAMATARKARPGGNLGYLEKSLDNLLADLRAGVANAPRVTHSVSSNGHRPPAEKRGALDSEKPKCDVEGCDSGWLKRFKADGVTPVLSLPPCPKCRPEWQ